MQTNDLQANLIKYFGYPAFREGQKEIIQDIMDGKDVLGVLPTGSGKSLCYQLPSLLMDGVTIVISPLISLMTDQVKQLKAMNFKSVVSLNSFNDYRERRRILQELDTFKLVYISPELLLEEAILFYLRSVNVNLIVIDEAHCISQWGHEFRPVYLKINKVIKQLNNPPILALSATVTKNIQKDIMNSLDRPNITEHIYPIDRDNIALTITEVTSEQEKIFEMNQLLSSYQVSTLIYFSSRETTERVSMILSQANPNHRIAYYHGGMEQIDRITIQQQFMNDQLDVICCTSAFGMGINKNNVRLIIHYHFPTQLESYMQEIGRAGRDGQESISILLYSKSDVFLPKSLIKTELPTEAELRRVLLILYKLSKEGIELPTEESEIYENLQINISQWRFIHSQLEKNGMIEDKRVIYNKANWKKGFLLINQYRKNRMQLKQDNLLKMINWIESKECLREQLYKSFQSTFKQPKYQCCTNCSFSINEFNPKQINQRIESELTWESKLKKKLLVGVNNETE